MGTNRQAQWRTARQTLRMDFLKWNGVSLVRLHASRFSSLFTHAFLRYVLFNLPESLATKNLTYGNYRCLVGQEKYSVESSQ